jgi:hypothetical protein
MVSTTNREIENKIGVINMNTIKQHKKQVADALIFTAKAKFTSASNLQLVTNRERRGFPTQLMEMGLLVSRQMAGGSLIFGLSKLGAETAGVQKFDIHKVTLGRVEHALIAQTETLIAAKKHGVVGYEFEPQDFVRDTRPDVIWVFNDESKTYIEIELSAKSIGDGDMDKFFLKLLSRKTIVIFRDDVLYLRYLKCAREYIQRGIPDWKLLDKKWIKFDSIKFDRSAWDRIKFRIHKGDSKIKLSDLYDAIKLGF